MAFGGVGLYCFCALVASCYVLAHRILHNKNDLVDVHDPVSPDSAVMLSGNAKTLAHNLDRAVDKEHQCSSDDSYLATSFAFWFGALKPPPQHLDLFKMGETKVAQKETGDFRFSALRDRCYFFVMCYDGKSEVGKTIVKRRVPLDDECKKETTIRNKCIADYSSTHSDAKDCETKRGAIERVKLKIQNQQDEIDQLRATLKKAKLAVKDADKAYAGATAAVAAVGAYDLFSGNSHSTTNQLGASFDGCTKAECLTCKQTYTCADLSPRRRSCLACLRRRRTTCYTGRYEYCCQRTGLESLEQYFEQSLLGVRPFGECMLANGLQQPSLQFVSASCTCIARCAQANTCEASKAAHKAFKSKKAKIKLTLRQMKEKLAQLKSELHAVQSVWASAEDQCEVVFKKRFPHIAACAVEMYTYSCEKACIDRGAALGAGVVEGNTPTGVLKKFLEPLQSWSAVSWTACPTRLDGSGVEGDVPAKVKAHWDSVRPRYAQKDSIQHEMAAGWNKPLPKRCVVLEFGTPVRSARLLLFPKDFCSNKTGLDKPNDELIVWSSWDLKAYKSKLYGDKCFKLTFPIPYSSGMGASETTYSFCLLESTMEERDEWKSLLNKSQVEGGTITYTYMAKKSAAVIGEGLKNAASAVSTKVANIFHGVFR
eukprot:TRINITY_DN39357_c0_g1_i1.p1 TRINITY_DN39357_c0_g1~~TRINITY_DN39357_c0_g1_i1.p1  ORF type:complete len:654 (+),score=37.18 TRINITY_DN39357_c0_g1_i1:50-2011(+)